MFASFVTMSLVLFLACSCQFVHAMIEEMHQTSNGPFVSYLTQSFGMTEKGSIQISYNVQSTHPGHPPTPLLLVIINENLRLGYYSTSGNNCNFPSLYRQSIVGQGNLTYHIGKNVDQISVLVMQCRNNAPINPIKVDVVCTASNPYPGGSGTQYLSIEETTMVPFLEGLLIVYLILLVALGAQIYYAPRFTKIVHKLFVVCMVLMILNIVARYAQVRYSNDTGNNNDGLAYFSQLTFHFSTFTNLTVLLFLSLGWSILRFFLSEREKQVAAVCLALYFILGLASASCLNKSACVSLTLAAYIMQNVVYLVIVIAMNLTVTQLRILLYHTPWIPTLTYQYARTKQFSVFRITFILYLLLPTAFLLIEALMFTWRETWLVTALGDILNLALVFHIGVSFGPINEWLLIRPFGARLLGRR